MRELQLPYGHIGRIKKEYRAFIKSATASLAHAAPLFGDAEYSVFKSQLTEQDPEFLKLLNRVEYSFDLQWINKFLQQTDRAILTAGPQSNEMMDILASSMLEKFIKQQERFPIGTEMNRFARRFCPPTLFNDIAHSFVDESDHDAEKMLEEHGTVQIKVESNLYKTWREPLNLLKRLILVAMDAGERTAKRLTTSPIYPNKYQISALVQIHARAIQITNEILTLLISGYADGAISRWRSLYELAVLCVFLKEQPDEISERYLDHDVMKRYKEMKEYHKHYRKLGQPPFGRKESARVRKEYYVLIKKYGPKVKYVQGYEWIPPSSIFGSLDFTKRNKRRVTFLDLEKHAGFQQWRPFYSLSSNAVHAGSRGFYRLGLIDQYELLLAGASNYGLADPLQNSAISLSQISTCLLTIDADPEDLIAANVLKIYSDRIGEAAVRIQTELESEELRLREQEQTNAD